ncbi:MAG: hypothetical protein Kow0047_28470 [Anaerolineae bacterium]
MTDPPTADPNGGQDVLPFPNLIVFVSNACIMTVELVAGRIVAPFLGVSLYTWTSVIGVVLAGISAGNYVGGRLADRHASRRFLGLIFLIAGLCTLSILWTAPLLGRNLAPAALPLWARIVLLIGAVFFIPSAAMGGISPVVVKLALRNLERSGNIVGQIYAYSALGSIVGTFATGFFLIAWLGTRTIVLGVGILLICLGLLIGRWASRALSQALVAGVAVAVFITAPGRWVPDDPCLRESQYYCIKVRDETLDDGSQVKVLILDRLVHSYTSPEDPTKLVYGYEKVYAEVAQYVGEQRPNLRALFIGGGGYTFPRFLEAIYPESQLDVVEIDPEVTAIAREMLGLSPQSRIRVFHQDARQFLLEAPPDLTYDLIIGDAFNDYSVPYHLTTLEFDELVLAHLGTDGIYMVNLIDGRHLQFISAYVRTLQRVFPHVYVIPVGLSWRDAVRSTFVVIGSRTPVDLERLQALDGGDGAYHVRSWLLSPEAVRELSQAGSAVELTDDYVPVDHLLAPVFVESER